MCLTTVNSQVGQDLLILASRRVHLYGQKGRKKASGFDGGGGMVFLVVKAAFGEKYLVVLTGQCLS